MILFTRRLHTACYDLLASEARTAAFVAFAKGEALETQAAELQFLKGLLGGSVAAIAVFAPPFLIVPLAASSRNANLIRA